MNDMVDVPPPLDEVRWWKKIEEARRMTFEEKFELGFLLAEQERIKLKNHFRSEHPDSDEATIQHMVSNIFQELRRRDEAEVH